MKIVLPPSETKTRPGSGDRLDLASLSHPLLQDSRSTMLRAAMRTARSASGASALGIPASSPELLPRMAALDEEPTAPALEVYSGVLYDALDGQQPRHEGQVLVTSALFGILDVAVDRIPAYRVSSGSRISRLGSAGSWWRKQLRQLGVEIAGEGGLVVDCRSGSYRSMMPIPGAVGVSAVRETAGRRSVISHEAKSYRGRLSAVLLREGAEPQDLGELADVARSHLPTHLTVEVEESTLVIVDHD